MTINEQLAELEDKLNLQDSKITGLKENVKWLYKYGGSGTGSGSGGGSSSSTKTPALVYQASTGNIIVELGSTLSNTCITTEGTLNLSFFIRYLSVDHVYKVSYSTNGGTSWSYITISETNDFSIPLTIQGNINVQVRLQDITDNSAGPAKLILGFITNPITITPYLVGENANGLATVSEEIFMLNYDKIWAIMDVTPHVTGSFTATSDSLPEDFVLTDMEVDKTYTNKLLLYDKNFLSDSTNVGAYSLKYSTEFNSELSGIKTDEFELAYTLIPNSTYAVIKAERGSVYSNKKDSDYYEFSAGSITFIGYIYKGSNDGETFLNVVAEIYNDLGTRLHKFPVSTPVTERANFLSGTAGTFYFNNDDISNANGNWFEIRITIALTTGDIPQVQSYYLFVKKNTNVLNWYPSTIAGDWYFNKENKSKIDGIDDSTSEISCLLSIDPLSYSWTNDLSLNLPEALIAIAINAEEGNDGVLLASLQSTVNSTIDIYQNKITIPAKGDIQIYIPMDNEYHLLQLYERIVDMESANEPKYEWVAYIDGIIEGALSSYTNLNINIKGFTLNPESKGVFTVNHFNYTVFDCNVYKRWDSGYLGMHDSNVTEYFYKYKCITNTYEEGDYAAAVQAFNLIKYTYDSSTHLQLYLTKLDASSVTNIQSYGGLPVLIFQVKQKGLDAILEQMKTPYKEELEPGAILLENIKYYKAGNTEAEACNSLLASSDYYYTIEIQGSSTKSYKFKNWELGINSNQTETIPIFSLDYNEDEGFFPEQSFTLKGDIVDSSHSINTSIGAFVNDNTTPFNVGYLNCLSGKPLLILVEHIPDDAAASEFYFLGIYNYNLGRKSKYNLNYADRPSLESGLKGFIVSTTSSISTKSTYASAEITNNSCFWDFSQYDSSILFENQYKMQDGSDPTSEFLSTHEDDYYMWGDLVYSQGFDINTKILDCVKSISRAGGFLFATFLCKDFDSNAYFTELTSGASSDAYKVINHVPDSKHRYTRKVKYNLTSNSYSYIFDKSETPEEPYTQLDLSDCIYGRKDAEGTITQQPYINYTSIMEYYVIMQAFGLVDSPMKNLNIKTWNGTTFYAAFYDMDTGLGGDNGGSLTITPFAFSDYWATDDSGIVTRHLDYWPLSTAETGFDVPSSFLFAIAKYAAYYQQANPTMGDSLLSPMEYWAKLRLVDGNLRNAEYFVNTYLNKHFTNTHPMLWNLNYRSKYLIQATDSYDTTQFSKFHGRRLSRIKAWLNNRLHMLDAYFNVNNLPYTAENNAEASLQLIEPDSAVTTLLSNSDVILLHNIFTNPSTDSIKTDTNINCTVEALDYSPFIAKSTSTVSNVRLFNHGNLYKININVTGNLSILPYGCARWTYIDSVNSFLLNGVNFYIKNDYITSLNCDKNFTTTFSPSGWELHTPKMLKIAITGSTFKNSLLVYPGTALTDLDLSNTSISFKTLATGSYNVCPNLKNVILNNFKGSITLNNCNLLSSLTMDNAVIDSLTINPYKGNCSFSNTLIKSLSIVADSENATFSLTNDTVVTSIELSGFKSVSIKNCKSLRKVILTGTLPETLEVVECYSGGVTFEGLCSIDDTIYKVNDNNVITFRGVKTLNLKKSFLDSSITKIVCDSALESINWESESGLTNTNNITIDLSSCTKLTKVNFYYSWAKYIIFNNINIDNSNVLLNWCRATSITGNLNITTNKAFRECANLTTLGNVTFADNVTDASYTFYNCPKLKSIGKLTLNNKITNIKAMFLRTAFTSTNILTTALGFDATIVSNMEACFLASPISDCNGFLNCDWDSITSENAMLGACNSSLESLGTKITQKHLKFKNALTVDPLCIFRPGINSYDSRSTIISFNEDALGATETTSLNFSNIGVRDITSTKFLTNALKCTSVSNLEFVWGTAWNATSPISNFVFEESSNQIVSFKNCILTYKVSTNSVKTFFRNFTNLSSSLSALSVTGGLPIYDFVDYDKLKGLTTLFSTDFAPLKTITDKLFLELVNLVLSPTRNDGSASKLTTINAMFKNCTITCTDDSVYESKVLDVDIPENSLITDISNMFEFCHAFFTDAEENKTKIYINFKSGENIGFSNLTKLLKCVKTWKDCYLNKLSSTWFANVEGQLTTCNNAFTFALFKLNYSDDMSDKVAYYVNDEIALGNQSNVSPYNETEFNCKVNESFYDENYKGHYIIPSEFLWYTDTDGTKKNKTSSQFNGTEMFMASTLYGLLPELLSRSNCLPTTNCKGMFKFCTIIPYHVKDIYQVLLPDGWSSLEEVNQKKLLSYTIYKVGIYCITPDGDATDENNIKPYLTNTSWLDSISGALIVPTIHQSRDVTVKWDKIKTQLTDATGSYAILTDITPESNSDITEDDISIGEIDFIYQFNTNSIPNNLTDFTYMLPTSIGIYDSFRSRESLSWSSNVDNNSWSTWDVMYDTLRGLYNNTYSYKLSPLFNYQPTTCSATDSSEDLLKNIKYSDELYKIHYGVLYNGGDNVLVIDDTNTDGLSSVSKLCSAIGLITDKAALLLYGPIFHKDMKVGVHIRDDYATISNRTIRMCDLISFGWYDSYGTIGDSSKTNDNSKSGTRYYYNSNAPLILYAYDISRNAIFPEAYNSQTNISNLVAGGIHQETSSNGKRYTIYRQITYRGNSIKNPYKTFIQSY